MKRARFFGIDERLSVIYLPERPNGFAVFLLSDHGTVVEEDTNNWEQHPEKNQFMEDLLQRGYTIMIPPVGDVHWGNFDAYDSLIQMYYSVIKQEILNPKIHLFAEGAGALLALRWMEQNKKITRSCYLVNPCLSLVAHYEQEQESKLYFKRFVKELAEVYRKEEVCINENWIESITPKPLEKEIPPLSIHCDMQEKRFPLSLHSRPFQQYLADQNMLINLRIHGNGKSFYKAAQSAFPFFQKHEIVL
ncbi:alpha/beta hydrolase [Bacillus suaedae]|uniref:Alpha/beta hydrolase n=1 Tax=Halalkalibacter suaedae TaxID=2822140 RepID=A0A940WNC6_9BACI|nr:alpha/beta hydrolase [Bacillus suaedae]MBP3949565.1 alpha/beta hydrolase [Bacillus suaedae]